MANLKAFYAPQLKAPIALVQMDGRDFSHVLSGHNKELVDRTLVDLLMQKNTRSKSADLYYSAEVPLQFINFRSDKRRTIFNGMQLVGKLRAAMQGHTGMGMNVLNRTHFARNFDALTPIYQLSDTAADAVFIGLFDASGTGLLKADINLNSAQSPIFDKIMQPSRLLGIISAWPLKYSAVTDVVGDYFSENVEIKVHHGLEVNDYASFYESKPRGLRALVHKLMRKTNPANATHQKFILTTLFEGLEDYARTHNKFFIKATGSEYFSRFFQNHLQYEPLESLHAHGSRLMKRYCKHIFVALTPILFALPFLKSDKHV